MLLSSFVLCQSNTCSGAHQILEASLSDHWIMSWEGAAVKALGASSSLNDSRASN